MRTLVILRARFTARTRSCSNITGSTLSKLPSSSMRETGRADKDLERRLTCFSWVVILVCSALLRRLDGSWAPLLLVGADCSALETVTWVAIFDKSLTKLVGGVVNESGLSDDNEPFAGSSGT